MALAPPVTGLTAARSLLENDDRMVGGVPGATRAPLHEKGQKLTLVVGDATSESGVDEMPRFVERAGPTTDRLLARQILRLQARAPAMSKITRDVLEVRRLDLSCLHHSPAARLVASLSNSCGHCMCTLDFCR